MTEKEFLEIAKEHATIYYTKQRDTWHSPDFCLRRDIKPRKGKRAEDNPEPSLKHCSLNDYLYVEWVSGGISGGSCWDDSSENHYAIDPSPEKELNDLDAILTTICPNLTFLQYKRLAGKVIKQDSRTENEYYGNSTVYSYKYVKLKDLYDALIEIELM
jgi:hypothetical protein